MTVEFQSLKLGDGFNNFHEVTFIKIEEMNRKNAVDIRTGKLHCFEPFEQVTPIGIATFYQGTLGLDEVTFHIDSAKDAKMAMQDAIERRSFYDAKREEDFMKQEYVEAVAALIEWAQE